MLWVCQRGSCILIPSGPERKSHVFTVAIGPKILDGYGAQDHVVLVSFTSVRPGLPHDTACVVLPGEHSFINHESYVYYREPRIEPVASVNSMIERGLWIPQAPCTSDLLVRIVNGFYRSKRVPRFVRDLL